MHVVALLALASCATAIAQRSIPSSKLASANLRRQHKRDVVDEEAFDYIIVGAGVAGTTLADRLTADGTSRVLLLEAGQLDQQEDFITVPGLAATAAGTKYDWNVTSTPSPATNNRSISLPMGKGVGGGSLINQMVFVRGSAADFDRWEEFTETGWGWADMLNNFIKSEIFTPPIDQVVEDFGATWDDSVHGVKGAKPGENTRSSGRTAHYDAAAGRPNLRLIQNARATRIEVDSGRAVGIEFVQGLNPTSRSIKARKEVILSAGAVFSPQLLQLSGIGDAKDLAALGIDAIVDLPGVGRNLQDHPLIVVVNMITSPLSVANLSNPDFASEMMDLYKSNRVGPYANPNGEFVMFLPTSNFSSNAAALYQAARAQDVAKFLPKDTPSSVLKGYTKQHTLLTDGLASDTQTPLEIFWNDGTLVFGAQHPFSRGSVKLVSKDPFQFPAVDPGYLTNPIDMAIMVDALKFARTITATSAMSSISPVEIVPGANVTTDAGLESYIRENLATFAHYSGTCTVGPRGTGGVVDDNFRVYGVRNLRVVDASVIPLLPAAHTSSTVYALAEKAAAAIISGVGASSACTCKRE
ncbi:GMC oxidoreductase family protein [Paramyrothecium foliicola]|nr:GMC oxidoreductase family protein [Paramyrothecium foliicola]